MPVEISKAVNENDLAVSAVLSGNRNFEGRISPDVKMNYLASPPLVVAYALAGTMDHDFVNDSLGEGSDGKPVYLADIWPSPQEIQSVIDSSISSEMWSVVTESPRIARTRAPEILLTGVGCAGIESKYGGLRT